MKWVNHILIAGAATAIINPAAVPFAVLGATAPDWIETVSNRFLGTHFKHRQETHYPVLWLGGIGFALLLWDYNGFLFWFCFGGLSHCLTDAMTVSGVPLGPWSDRRFHLFGGRFRTGDPVEYMISFAFCALCVVVHNSLSTGSGFMPFLFNWGEYYDQGLISGKEWKENRFKFF